MGVIQRQGIKTATIGYIGTALGAISTLWIYPLDTETYGLIQFIIGLATFLTPFASLGIVNLTVRFFPNFRNDSNFHHGYLGLLLSAAALSILIFISFAILWKPTFINFLEVLQFDSRLFTQNYATVLAIAAMLVIIQIFSGHSTNFKRIVFPTIFKNIYPKVAFAILVLSAYFNLISDKGIQLGLIILHLLILLSLAGYLLHLKQFNLSINTSFLSIPLLKNMGNYALYGVMGGLGGIIAFRLDSIMVASMVDLQSNGIYNIALFISNVIAIPLSAAENISAPIISNAWKDENRIELRDLYSRSTIILLVAGLFIFLSIWIAVDDIFRLTPRYDILIQGKNVLLFLGLAQLINMATGVNNQIIIHSPQYRYNLLLILMLAGLNIFSNLWLIPIYGIAGAAMATALSLTVYNLLKYLFIWWKFGLQPLRLSFFIIIILGLITYYFSLFLPKTNWPIVNIIFAGLLVLTSFLGPILFFKLVPDLNLLVSQMLRKVKAYVHK